MASAHCRAGDDVGGGRESRARARRYGRLALVREENEERDAAAGQSCRKSVTYRFHDNLVSAYAWQQFSRLAASRTTGQAFAQKFPDFKSRRNCRPPSFSPTISVTTPISNARQRRRMPNRQESRLRVERRRRAGPTIPDTCFHPKQAGSARSACHPHTRDRGGRPSSRVFRGRSDHRLCHVRTPFTLCV